MCLMGQEVYTKSMQIYTICLILTKCVVYVWLINVYFTHCQLLGRLQVKGKLFASTKQFKLPHAFTTQAKLGQCCNEGTYVKKDRQEEGRRSELVIWQLAPPQFLFPPSLPKGQQCLRPPFPHLPLICFKNTLYNHSLSEEGISPGKCQVSDLVV